MCGGCGRRDPGDWLGQALGSLHARAVAARAVTDLLGRRRGQVEAHASGFVVRRPTGRATMASTLDAVWTEALRLGRVTLPEAPLADGDLPPRGTPQPGHSEPGGPRAGDLALAVTDDPSGLARLWDADRVIGLGSQESLVAAISQAQTRRTLVWAAAARADEALRAVCVPMLRLRATVTAVVRDGEGPAWATDLSGLDEAARRTALAGARGDLAPVPGLSVAGASAWISGIVATGATRGRRVSVCAGDGTVLDAAHGHGLAVRPPRTDACRA